MPEPPDILVVDDEEAICYAFRRCFEARGWRVRVAGTGAAGLAAYRAAPADVVFLDVRLPDANGLDVLGELLAHDPACRAVVITAHGSLETVRRAVEGRAFDYLAKPIDLDRAVEAVGQALEARRVTTGGAPAEAPPTPADAATPAAGDLVGASPVIQEVYKRVSRVARTESTALIQGETGTGKELIARAVHAQSGRAGGLFVPVNCAALPESLVESELFGHVRGAFTGAEADRAGRFEAADGGTVFLDEVGELPPAVQVKLLRFLDNQVVERLGSLEPLRVDVRILAATNRDLAGAVAAGAFRQDLFYRLAVIRIHVPPLRARREDVPALVDHFLSVRGGEGGPPPAVSDEAMHLLVAYDWPGNVRELKNAVEHAVVVSGGGPVLPAHLPEGVRRGPAPAPPGDSVAADLDRYVDRLAEEGPEAFRTAIADLERRLIARALAETGGNQSAAAERLGIHRNTLRTKIRAYGLDG